MAVMIALLRGINVGGHNKLPMADLRTAVAACGFEAVETYIQSGNVVFDGPPDPDVDAVADEIARTIESLHGPAVAVTVRTRADLVALIADNPFVADDDDPTHHHVLFRLADDPPMLGDLTDSFDPERAAAHARDVYLHLPGGIGRSPLATALGKRPGLDGTVRNWRTTNKLLEMADAHD